MNTGNALGLTVEAWVDAKESRAEGVQALVSKWDLGDAFGAFDAYDAGDTDGLDSKGFLGAVYDGRYVYFSPQANATVWENGSRRHGVILRYDTQGDFRSAASWQAYDAGETDGLCTRGYYGAVFDGQHVYFVPRFDGTDYHSRVLRYDTRKPFKEPGSWSAHDAGLPVSHQGAAFDGRHIYFCPGHRPVTSTSMRGNVPYNTATSEGGSGEVLRYDTQADFKDPAAWCVYDAAGTSGLPTCYLDGAVFDGTYVYLVPLYHRAVLRHDTRKAFADKDSWRAFDAGPLGMDMCVGAVYDGRHVYFVPYSNGVVVRYDTAATFTNAQSWSAADATGLEGLGVRGWDGGAFDGRYVYFIPFLTDNGETEGPDGFHGVLLRYDTTGSFADQGSWSWCDAGRTGGLDARGYNGGAFDGRYLYCAPWQAGDGEGANIKGHGRVLRYDTLGTNGSFSLQYAGCGHNGGLGAALPGPTFLVNTRRGAVSVSANRMPPAGRHCLVGTYDGRTVRLFIDGELSGSRTADGAVQDCDAALAVGCLTGGCARFRGVVLDANVSDGAQSADWIAAAYRENRSAARGARVDA